MACHKRGLTKSIGIGLVCLFLAGSALAGLPLLAFLVEPSAAFVEGLVIRTVARQAVLTVGVAANDASWIVPLTNLVSRAAAILRIAGAVNSYEIPLQADEPVPGSFLPPVGMFKINQSLSVGMAADNALHYYTNGTTYETLDSARAPFVAWWNSLAKSEYQIVGHEAYSAGTTYTQIFDIFANGRSMQYVAWLVEVEAKDQSKRFVRDENGFLPDPDDPDWTQEEKSNFATGKALQFQSQGQIVRIAVNPEGTTQLVAVSQTGADVYKRVADLTLDGKASAVTEQLVKSATAADVLGSVGTGTEPGTGTGTGTGGSCGGSGLPPCEIGDSGFDRTRDWEKLQLPDLETQSKSIGSSYKDPELDWSVLRPTLLPGAALACHPLEFHGLVSKYGLDATTTFDPCWMFEILRGLFGYLFLVTTSVYVWNRFLGTADAGKGKGK